MERTTLLANQHDRNVDGQFDDATEINTSPFAIQDKTQEMSSKTVPMTLVVRPTVNVSNIPYDIGDSACCGSAIHSRRIDTITPCTFNHDTSTMIQLLPRNITTRMETIAMSPPSHHPDRLSIF
jgi:hypothetical protein